VRGRVGEGPEPHAGVLLVPDLERRVAVAVGCLAGQGRGRVAGADQHLVAQLGQPAGDGLADHAGSQDADPHADLHLFLRHGFRAVGVDTIVAEAGVAKMTLYAHFPSKDDLIVAHLDRANEQFWEWLEGAGAGVDDPKRKLVAMFEAVGKLARRG
jgi:hypothetical protein